MATYSITLCVFQLEDDVVAREGYYNNMKAFAIQEASKPWLYLEFSQLGFIGMCLGLLMWWRYVGLHEDEKTRLQI